MANRPWDPVLSLSADADGRRTERRGRWQWRRRAARKEESLLKYRVASRVRSHRMLLVDFNYDLMM